MARINTSQLVQNATNIGYRGHQVQQDPAVQKAWRAAGDDAVRAVQSVGSAVFETRAAWHRTGTGGSAHVEGRLA